MSGPRGTRRRTRGLALGLVASLAWSAPLAAQAPGPEAGREHDEPAQDRERDEPEQEREQRGWGRQERPDPELSRRPVPGAKVMERHAEAIEHLFEERYAEAVQELDKLYFKRMNPVEKFLIHRDYAYIAAARDQREEARNRLAAAIAVPGGGLPSEISDARFQIAMLWMQDESWSEAAETLEVWFQEEPEPNANAYYILALNYYQLEEFDRALVPAQRAIELAEEPKESWLQLLLALRLLKTDYREAIPILEQLVSLYPSKTYFTSLSTVYGALGDYEEAAIPLQLAYEQGLLTEDSELRRLGQLMLFLELPYRAAKLLDEGLEAEAIEADSEVLAMLSNSWIAAREYAAAVEPMERAASLAGDGELYLRLAQVHVQREDWEPAVEALQRGLDKGGLRAPGDAHLLMGIALYSQQRRDEARRWFRSASDFETARDEAKVWIQHIDQELAEAAAAEDVAAGG